MRTKVPIMSAGGNYGRQKLFHWLRSKEVFMVIKTFVYSLTAISFLGCSACFAAGLNYEKVEKTYTQEKPDSTSKRTGTLADNVSEITVKKTTDQASTTLFRSSSPSLSSGSTGPTKPTLPTSGGGRRQ
jgi:hypothetical protein